MHFAVFVFLAHWICHIHTEAAEYQSWRMNDLVNDVKNKPIGALFNDMVKKATGEFDKLYHQLDGVLRQLSGARVGDHGTEEVEGRQLDPRILSDCNCYCRCPHDNVNSRIVGEVRDKVIELKKKVENVGKSIKDKIHEITSR